jgi:hypothetical protein
MRLENRLHAFRLRSSNYGATGRSSSYGVTGPAPCVVTQIRAVVAEYVTPCSVLDITVSNARLFEIQIV